MASRYSTPLRPRPDRGPSPAKADPYDRILQPHPGSKLVIPQVLASDPIGHTQNVTALEEKPLKVLESFPSSPPASASTSRLPNDSMPFTYRHGRRFLRDPSLPYPLPVDLIELHRQTLRTLVFTRVFDSPFCSPFFKKGPPKKVLELACGSGFWSSLCYDHFKEQGHANVSFTGMDLAPIAPDLKQRGINWRFIQHDLRKQPWPFADGEFDFVFIKDASFCTPTAELQVTPLAEPLRILKVGGVIETWESDHLFRNLLPHSSRAPGIDHSAVRQADLTATYPISASTAFQAVQNKYLVDYNMWVQKALDKRKLTAVPCALTAFAFSSSPDVLADMGSRRIAVPLGEIRWEREGVVDHPQKEGSPSRVKIERRVLSADQAALRRTALLTVLQFIDSLEPLLKEASGKRQDEWDRWWAGMTTNLLEQNGTINGGCLEIGAWWGQKKAPDPSTYEWHAPDDWN